MINKKIMKKNNNTAFTLVELIVVITILAVLATVAFISFQRYASSSRDSVRLADLKNISKSFEINRTKNIDFPLPDKKVDISSSGTIFQYQGELSQNILKSDLNIFNGGLDPVTLKPYGYAINLARNKFQIIWFLENSETTANFSNSKTFADNSDKYVKTTWDKLWILLNDLNNELITKSGSLNEIDIKNITSNYSIVTNNKVITWNKEIISGEIDFRFNKIKDCRAILYNWNSTWNGFYTINPTWVESEEYEVYCNMKDNWGGWTKISAEISNDNYRLVLLDLIQSDNFTNSSRNDDCYECGSYPQYIKTSSTGHNDKPLLGKYICKDKLNLGRRYSNIEISYFDDIEIFTWKDGMFVYDYLGQYFIRSENEFDYWFKKEIYCR